MFKLFYHDYIFCRLICLFCFLTINIIAVNAQDLPTESIDSIDAVETLPAKTTYYIEAGSYGTKRESDPPNYVRNAGKLGLNTKSDLSWLNLGLDTRARGEWRHNDIRRPESFSDDFPLLLRQRAYFGVTNILDPLRFAVEFEDARRINGNYPLDNRDVNQTELIQGYVELYFKKPLGTDALGNNRPISIRFGRMAFEFLDRRLIGLNQWRNTTNNFTGLKLALGQDKNDFQFDALVLRPIIRDIDNWDKTDKDRLFTAVIGHWRKWSEVVTIEPYYMGLKQSATDNTNNRARNIHGVGLRLYGWVKDSGVNYDVNAMYQFGEDNQQQQQAYAVMSEVGYTILSSKLKPRFSAFLGYVSGDKNSNDNKNNRFERYFGFARPWSADDYIVMENIITPKLKVEFQTKIKEMTVRFDGGYSFYWLASKTDRFNNLLNGSNNRDVTGNSGNALGHGLDFRTRFSPTPYIDANIGYSHFTNGEFVQNSQFAANGETANSSDFVYIELSFNVFDLVKSIHVKK
jgi:hypothetical protein